MSKRRRRGPKTAGDRLSRAVLLELNEVRSTADRLEFLLEEHGGELPTLEVVRALAKINEVSHRLGEVLEGMEGEIAGGEW